jgi:DNA-binding NtrC family response regulator
MVAVNNALYKQKTRFIKKQDDKPSAQTYNMVGHSEGMISVFKGIARASSVAATVLITGESGTGKELVARAIHYSSDRGKSSFIPVNCGGIPESLLDSELFGTGKGASSAEKANSMSLFQVAEGGTLFLDGIGSLPLNMQTKLLRLLEDKNIFISTTGEIKKINVRIMAATNKDLKTMVQNGTFREDLYYRLNVINIALPPLRERGDDISMLAEYFAEKISRDLGKAAITFTDYACQIMKQYCWPGNVRELENLVQQLSIMTEQTIIDITDLPQYMRYSLSGGDLAIRTLAEMEKEYILSIIAQVGGNKSRAAELLGIDRKTLREKLKKFGEDYE